MFRGDRLLRIVLAAWLAIACIALAGCGAFWRVKEKADTHALPKRVTLFVAMTPAVAESDAGLGAAVVDALVMDLTRRGYDVTIELARAGDVPPAPRIELQIIDSKGGSPAMRGAGQFAGVFGLPGAAAGAGLGAAGSSSITVDCYVVTADGRTTFKGRVAGLSLGNTTGYDSVQAGEAVGLEIASTIAE